MFSWQLDRYCFVAVAAVILHLVLGCAAARAEYIRSFVSDLTLSRDCSLDVVEVVRMDFENVQRHGIYRHIPVRYDRWGSSFTIDLKVLSVTDEQDRPYHYSLSQQGREVNMRIGDPNVYLTGQHTYRIHYKVRRAINFLGDAPELYWNAVGNDWPFAIQHAAAVFRPPEGTPIDQIRTACYAGPLGAQRPGRIRPDSTTILFYENDLRPGEGLTIVAGLPKGAVTRPSLAQEFFWLLQDWWLAFVIPLVVIGLMGAEWWRSGRDQGGSLPVAVEWNPPKGLSPASVGALYDERCDMTDVVSTLIDLAARGHLKIEETESGNGFLFLSNRDFIFTKTLPPENSIPLSRHEQLFLNGLFTEGINTVTLSRLRNKFYIFLPKIRQAIYNELMEKELFTQDPDVVRKLYRALSLGLLLAGIVASAWWHNNPAFWGAAVSAVFVWLMSSAMPSRTVKGSKTLNEVLGFQRFVRLCEKERIRVLAKDDPTIFGRLLPYAMVLGVADQWAEAFRGLLDAPPDWYQPYGWRPGQAFSSGEFVGDLGRAFHTMGDTLSSSPKSEAGSGGSGFSGGFSGGGFGGGGGGSW